MPKGFQTDINWAQVAIEVEAYPHGAKGQKIEEIASLLGVSVATVHRRLKSVRGPQRKLADRDSKYTAELVREALKMQEEYRMIQLRGSSRQLSTKQLIRLMEEQDLIKPGDWSVSGLNAAIRKSGYRLRKARLRVEAEHYCQQFQIDFSRSKHFQVIGKDEEGRWVLRVSAKELHYKDGAVRVRLWVTQMIDEYSRLRVIQYNVATGESPLLGITFLDWYFNRPDDEHFMRHVPDAIRGDQGSFMKSQEAINALDSLGIEHRMASPENKETQGKVERGFRDLWSRYEAGLAQVLVARHGLRATVTLGELNQWINSKMVEEQAEKHPVFRQTSKAAVAQRSALNVRAKAIDADVLALAFRTWERVADDSCMVSVDGVQLEVPHYCAGKSVRIHKNMHDEYVGQMIDGYTEKPFIVHPYEYAKLGQFNKSRPKAYSEIIREEVQREHKVRALAPKAEKKKPETVFTQAEKAEGKPNVDLDRKLKLVEAKHEYANQLAYYCSLEDPDNAIPQMVLWAVEEGVLYNNITRGEVKRRAQEVADAIDARMAS